MGGFMLLQEDHLPQYVKIKYYLRKLITELDQNEKIPAETLLAQQFGVSRGTVKQAIMDLVYEGVLYRKQGKGTFVTGRIARTYDRLPTFTDDIRRAGHFCTTQHLKLSQAAPALRAREFFHLQDGEEVIRYKRLVLQDDEPVAVVSSFLNPHLYAGITLTDIDDSLYAALRKKFNAAPSRAYDSYSIANISPHTAQLLRCEETDMVCYSERRAYLENNEPAEYVESYIRADRFKVEIFIDGKQAEDGILHPNGM